MAVTSSHTGDSNLAPGLTSGFRGPWKSTHPSFHKVHVSEFCDFLFKARPLLYKQPTNKLKIRILSQTSIIVYLICHASVILIVGLQLHVKTYANKRTLLEENSGAQWDRTSNLWITDLSLSQLS